MHEIARANKCCKGAFGNRLKSALMIASVVLAAIPAVQLAMAHQGATGIVKTRMDDMKAIETAMKTLLAMIKKPRTFNHKTAIENAAFLAKRADALPKLFPKGSNPHPSEALPAIWANWPDFKAKSDTMKQYANAISTLPSSAGVAELRPIFAELANTCSSCHKAYRKK